MQTLSVLERLATRAGSGPDAPAITEANGNSLSRGSLIRRASAVARGFTAAGLQPGDRVLYAVRPSTVSFLLMTGILEAGGVVVPMPSTMGSALFRSRLELLSPKWVVAESVLYLASASRLIRRLLYRRGVTLPPISDIDVANVVRVGRAWPGVPPGLSVAALEELGELSDDSTPATLEGDAAAFIVFTSGTTGDPKAVLHSRRSMQGTLELVGSLMDAGAGDVVYARDLHLIVPALLAEAAVVIPRISRFSAKRTVRDLEKFRVTHFFGVTAELQAMVDYLRTRNRKLPRTLREIWIGAAPVHAAFLQEFRSIVAADTQVWCVYGMTEILPVARVSLEDKLLYEGEGDLVGECVPGVSARVSTNGELVVSGANLCPGYVGEPRRTEHATGDFARLDNGRIALLGRRKDMIIRGRFNIYPELYETTIDRIDGVRRCAMVGFYDDAVADERVVLAVEQNAGVDASELEKRLWRELRDGPFSIDVAAMPDAILVMELPVAGRSSKVDKASLREYARQKTSCASR